LYYLALTYNDMGAEDWAREKLIALAERFPRSPHMAAGQKLLASLNAKQPTEAVADNHQNMNAEILVSRNGGGLPQPVNPPSLTPVPSLRHSGIESPPAEATLCRLGVWC
jgi:outer membrane protein assembly factor BamD